jgi:hypothetical protein
MICGDYGGSCLGFLKVTNELKLPDGGCSVCSQLSVIGLYPELEESERLLEYDAV